MSVDYRVTLGCGHTHDYRTTVHPFNREHLMCSDCGPDQLAVGVRTLSSEMRSFSDFGPREDKPAFAPHHASSGHPGPSEDETGAMRALDTAWPANEYSAADLLAAYRAGRV